MTFVGPAKTPRSLRVASPAAAQTRSGKLTSFDVNLPLQIAALDASIGRIAPFQGPPREGPQYAPEQPFLCNRELALTAEAGVGEVPHHGPLHGRRSDDGLIRDPWVPTVQDRTKSGYVVY